jgi:diguanylate cyclase (GGDEF)-like protein
MKISGNRPGRTSASKGVDAYTSAQKAKAGRAPAKSQAPVDATSVLGIPEAEFTPSVRDAIQTLLAEVERLREEVRQVTERLEAVKAVADQDGLLPLLNRRAFVREMSRIISFGDRYDMEASLVYFDLDGFKAVNDTHGHAAGDEALRHVAQILVGNVRESDIVGRLGGDEFGLILPKADRDAAETKAQSLADELTDNPCVWNEASLQLTVAFGVHTLSKGESPEDAMANADKAMYAAKRKRKAQA